MQHPDDALFLAKLTTANGGTPPRKDREFREALLKVHATDPDLVDRVATHQAIREALGAPRLGTDPGRRDAGVALFARATQMSDERANRVAEALTRVSKLAIEGSRAVLGTEGVEAYPPLRKSGVRERIDAVSSALRDIAEELSLGGEE